MNACKQTGEVVRALVNDTRFVGPLEAQTTDLVTQKNRESHPHNS